MDPSRPELYLDPLLPLHVRRDPVVMPRVAHAGVRGILVCEQGRYTVIEGSARTALMAPGLMRVDLAAGLKLTGGNVNAGRLPTLHADPGSTAGRPTTRGWLVVIGGRLLDQLIVGAFGDPGFSRFLDELDSPGQSACDSLDEELDSGLEDLASELADRRPAYRVWARSLLTNVLLSLYRSSLMTPELSNGDGMRLGAVLDHIGLHYAEELSLADLAGLMGTSPSYFSKAFRKQSGCSPREFVASRRSRA